MYTLTIEWKNAQGETVCEVITDSDPIIIGRIKAHLSYSNSGVRIVALSFPAQGN